MPKRKLDEDFNTECFGFNSIDKVVISNNEWPRKLNIEEIFFGGGVNIPVVSSKEELNQSMEAGVGEKSDLGAKSSDQEILKLVKDGKCVISSEIPLVSYFDSSPKVSLAKEKSDKDEELNIESGA
ncbi:hypothetical protein V6N11_058688 [Hibiscus sabdariffa]|uniref:Uncharacterized protein n=1 Tax=Hibiscus sabdariffa TaxID=183260 RepID=A0ABR2U5L4_9ROSI